jgi:hypothetical protein
MTVIFHIMNFLHHPNWTAAYDGYRHMVHFDGLHATNVTFPDVGVSLVQMHFSAEVNNIRV